MLTIHLLTAAETTDIYETHMKQDFPADELKPLSSMLNLMAEGYYKGYGLYEKQELRAYGFLAKSSTGTTYLLDYLAVCAPYRGQDYGSRFLKELHQLCDLSGILIEVESLRTASDEDDHQMRQRRIAFYKKNGVQMTELMANCFGVEFSLMHLCHHSNWTTHFIKEELDAIYRTLFPAHLYEKHIRFLI